jgi:hypothetical protein
MPLQLLSWAIKAAEIGAHMPIRLGNVTTRRPAYYAAAAALESSGLEGLVPARPGPRGGHKLTEEVLAWAEEQLAADPALRPAQLPDRIADAFGVRVHPRSVERALARRRERHSKGRGPARPRDAEGG